MTAATIDRHELEAEILAVEKRLTRPSRGMQRPLRALDERAMQLASRDRDLRAALFRLVDVTPATRGLDDLGSHLAGLIGELTTAGAAGEGDERRPHEGRAGGAGAAVAAGVRHMSHRFIVGTSANDARRELRGMWEDGIASTVDLLGEVTVAAAEADAYRDRCLETLEQLAAICAEFPDGGILGRLAGRDPARQPLGQGFGADAAPAPRGAGRGAADAAIRLRPLLAGLASSTRTCTWTWSRSTPARRRST